MGVEFILNPYDEYAVEEAIKIKEESGADVTVLTVDQTVPKVFCEQLLRWERIKPFL